MKDIVATTEDEACLVSAKYYLEGDDDCHLAEKGYLCYDLL